MIKIKSSQGKYKVKFYKNFKSEKKAFKKLFKKYGKERVLFLLSLLTKTKKISNKLTKIYSENEAKSFARRIKAALKKSDREPEVYSSCGTYYSCG
jgi:hypothetical protein